MRAWIRDMQGRLATAIGEPAAAIGELKQVLNTLTKTHWVEETDITFYVRLHLARAYFAAGRVQEAEATARRALAICAMTATPAHPDCQAIRISYAEIVLQADGPGAATTVLQQVDRQALAALGAEHPIQGQFHRIDGLIAQRQERTALAIHFCPALWCRPTFDDAHARGTDGHQVG